MKLKLKFKIPNFHLLPNNEDKIQIKKISAIILAGKRQINFALLRLFFDRNWYI